MTSLSARDQMISQGRVGPTQNRPRHWWRRFALVMLLVMGWLASTQVLAANPTCSPATSQGTYGPADYATYCWFDLSAYNNATANSSNGQDFVFTLPGGATVSFKLKTTGSLIPTIVPSWSGAAFGQAAFVNIPGKPVLYIASDGTSPTFQLTGISVAANGSSNLPFAIVAADGESTNTGEKLTFTTIGGSNWTTLATIRNGTSNAYPTLAGAGTATVTETGADGTVGAYAFTSNFPSSGTSSVTGSMTGSGLQGALFGVKFYAADLAITKSHTGNFIAGGNGSYNIAVRNNGPDTATGVTTVTDTLPTGLTYASASGSGWTCSAASQVVTCTNPNQITNGANLPALTLNVNVAADAPNTINNTATVSNPTFDYNTSNSSSTDPTTIIHSDLSTSTKTVVDTNGSVTNPGDTLRYTITIKEKNGVAASGASVTDDMPAGVTGLNVTSTPAGSTNASNTTGGANGTGQVNVSGISVPANGSVTIVYEVTVAAGGAQGSTIDNTATITNPAGPGAMPAAPTITVSQVTPVPGTKILYVQDNSQLTRTPQVSITGTPTAPITIHGGTSATWTLTPSVATGRTLIIPAQVIAVNLIMTATGNSTGSNRPVVVSLLNGAAVIASATSRNITSGSTSLQSFAITIPATTIAAGGSLNLWVQNNNGTSSRSIAVSQKTASGFSSFSFNTSTVINVDSVNIYAAAYSSIAQKTSYAPGDTVYVRAVISDPFGSYDVNHATLKLTDPNGVIAVNGIAMTQMDSNPTQADSNPTGAATHTYEYSYTLPANAPIGNWTAGVTGYEGTEGMVQRTANGAFKVVGVPNLTVMKAVTVVSDPVEGTTNPKAIPGAVMQYQITVTNNGSGSPDISSLIVTDPLPTDTKFVPSSFVFTPDSSGLTSANVTYFDINNASITPTDDGSGADPRVTKLQIAPQGTMAAKAGTTAPAPSFNMVFKVIIK